MAEFDYHIIDADGRKVTGTKKAGSADLLREELAGKGLFVLSVSAKGKGKSSGKPADKRDGEKAKSSDVKSLFSRKKLSRKQLSLFTRQLSSLVQVSPLEESLRLIVKQTEKPEARQILEHVHGTVLEGKSLTEAMGQEKPSFSPLYRAMVRAGERSGTLDAILSRLADLLEKQAEIRGKLLSSLAYPVILSIVAMLVVAGLMISVVPKVVAQFDDMDADLPLITNIVIGLSDFLASYWWILALLFAVGILLLIRGLRHEGFRYRFDKLLLKLPFIGRLIRDVNAARLARTLANMVDSRLPLLEGMQLASQTMKNAVLRRALEDCTEAIRQGGSLSAALKKTGLFPPLLVYLTASGESSGQLGLMLARAADYLEREFDNFTSAALSLLEPAIIVVMGGVVMVIILAILLPILQLQDVAGL